MQLKRISLTAIPGRVYRFLLFLVASVVAVHSELTGLVNLSLKDDRYTYVAVMPLVAIGLVLLKWKPIVASSRYSFTLGIPLMATGIVIALEPAAGGSYAQNFSAGICGIVVVWVAGFVLFFGPKAAWIARFPLALLFLTIPVPATVLDYVTTGLQNSSAYMSAILFRVIGVPILRQGLIFSLPGFDIQIAPQCSGIRSSISLVIASGLAGYLLLRTAVHRLFVVFVTIPLVILKNAIRIVALSTAALYVNQGFLHGNLHRYGGLCFSLLDIVIVLPLLLRFHTSESRTPNGCAAPAQNVPQ